jgi:hypothetical protein
MDVKDKILKEIIEKSESIFEYGYVGDYIKVDKVKDIINKYITDKKVR